VSDTEVEDTAIFRKVWGRGGGGSAPTCQQTESSLILFLSVDDGGSVTTLTGVLNASLSKPFGYFTEFEEKWTGKEGN
jgi:hypothetical protein